jgi:hypothetical protein
VRQDDQVPTIRVLSVDAAVVGGGRRRRPFGDDVEATIRQAAADVVCVHNAPHLGRWRQRSARLARRSGHVVVAAGGRAAGGNLLLSTLSVDVGLTLDRPLGGAGLHPPGAALAVLRRNDRDLLVVGARLVGNAAERLGQARELRAAIEGGASGDRPCLVSAVGTDRPGTAAWQNLSERRAALFGRLFVDERIDVRAAEEFHGPGAVLAVLEF